MLALVSHLLTAWFAFALPAYATYKAIARSNDLHDIAIYWSVLGLVVAFEHTLGLFLSWLPFYWEIRTIFLLYLSLPQTQGATHVYNAFLEPWLASNEAHLDASLAAAQSNAIAFCRDRITALVDLVWGFLNNPAQSNPAGPHKPVDQLKGLWATYSPSFLAAFTPKNVDTAKEAEHVHEPYSVN